MDDLERDTSYPLDEFSAPTADEWRAAAVASLGGQPFEKLISRTYEDIPLQPLYRREDTAELPFAQTLPGQPPYLRGRTAAGATQHGWAIAQEISEHDPAAFNAALIAALEHGQTAVTIRLDDGAGVGLRLATAADAAAALRGVYLHGLPIILHAGPTALPLLALLAAARPAGTAEGGPAELTGSIAADPLAALAETGALPLPLASAYDDMAAVAEWAAVAAPQLATAAVRADLYHEAGGSAVHELAFALATGAAYLRALTERGVAIDTAAASVALHFAIGGQFFMEVAKLRAARLLWAQVVAAFGASPAAGAVRLYARTARRNKSAIDPHVNMLRATTEALAAAVGGADSVCVAPFDEPLGAPDDFSRHIARNVQIILQDEAHMKRLIDPAGGSYAVESLTDQLARAAWALFQEIERQGGMAAALESGSIQSSIAAVAGKRAAALAKRRDVLVGVNQFANPNEQLSAPPAPAAVPAADDAEREGPRPAGLAEGVAAAARLDAAIAAAAAGATRSQLATALRGDSAGALPTPTATPLRLARAAAPFEALRRKALSLTLSLGEREPDPLAPQERVGERVLPRLFLANLGPPRQHKARADFTQGFFEVGGFRVITNNGFATPDEAAAAALASGAPAVAICSTDETYPELVPPLVAAIKAAAPQTVVILAGRPAEQVEALRAAGVDEFIYLGADALAINGWLLEQIARA